MTELVTLLGDTVIGTVTRDRNGRLSFEYENDWRWKSYAYPLSLSMPLAAKIHGHATIETFLWGLLPDNERVLERWGKRFQVSPRSAFALLAHVGEDCAGAVRFARPERFEELDREGDGIVHWLTEKDVAERLRALRADASAWRSPNDSGQFSLAGAQPKTALLLVKKRWGVPSGRIPTTHILKPGAPGLHGHAENEHFCLTLAAELGLPVASSRVQRFDGEVAIVIERYDRVQKNGRIIRVHQEDACQALAVRPENKYENDGGPGAIDIVRLLRESSRAPAEDVETFLQALAYNWLVAGTDGHAKNYSMLIGEGGRIRLAPLYDIASSLPYFDATLRKLKLAMAIGGKYRIRDVGAHQWRKLASELAIDGDGLIEKVSQLAEQVADLSLSVLKRLHEDGIEHAALNRLADGVRSRARESFTALTRVKSPAGPAARR